MQTSNDSGASLTRARKPSLPYSLSYSLNDEVMESVSKVFDVRQMDFEEGLSQVGLLLYAPSQVFKMTAWRSQTRGKWARDDPVITFLVFCLTIFLSILYSVLDGNLSPANLIRTIARNLICTVVIAFICSTIYWFIVTNKIRSSRPHRSNDSIEFFYSLDIHFSASIPVLLYMYLGQLFFRPMIQMDNWASCAIGNSIVFAALADYFYVAFLGYLALPFLSNDKVTLLLSPIALVVLMFIVFTLLKINVSWWLTG